MYQKSIAKSRETLKMKKPGRLYPVQNGLG
jgi:hypothetical protein